MKFLKSAGRSATRKFGIINPSRNDMNSLVFTYVSVFVVTAVYIPSIISMYVCMVTHIARVWINRVRSPTLLVVSRTGKMNISLSTLAPENLVSRDGFGSPIPRQPAHLHT